MGHRENVVFAARSRGSPMNWSGTPLVSLLGIDLPIIQAPIGSAVSPELVAAVSNAGGLGMLALSWKPLADARLEIQRTLSLTSKPFGVNLVLAWDQHERLDLCLELGVKIISLSWGDPTSYLSRLHRANAICLQTVGSGEEARRMVDLGVHVLVAQGWEAGGHLYSGVSTMALLPRVVDSAQNVPVVAAGGIADGRGIVAALSLGAAGVWLGTRFLASEEARTHKVYREQLLAASETQTAYVSLFDGGWENAPHRVIRNSTVVNWERAGRPPHGSRPSEGQIVASFQDGRPIYRYDDVPPTSEVTGEVECLPLYAGQGVGMLAQIMPAALILRQLADQTSEVLDGLLSLSATSSTKR